MFGIVKKVVCEIFIKIEAKQKFVKKNSGQFAGTSANFPFIMKKHSYSIIYIYKKIQVTNHNSNGIHMNFPYG